MKSKSRQLVFLLFAILAALVLPSAVDASTKCHTYSDGCTICDFYGPKGEYQGYIEWCN
jgi:hypothetical protein